MLASPSSESRAVSREEPIMGCGLRTMGGDMIGHTKKGAEAICADSDPAEVVTGRWAQRETNTVADLKC